MWKSLWIRLTLSQLPLSQPMWREWCIQLDCIHQDIFNMLCGNLVIFKWSLYYSNRTESSKPAHKTAAYIVYENCLLQLFEQCPVCQGVASVRRRRVGTFLAVEQRCPHCDFFRKWNSQPVVGSTPAGNLQLSVAVYSNGASFFTVKQVGWWGFYCLAYNLLLQVISQRSTLNIKKWTYCSWSHAKWRNPLFWP